MWTSSPRRSASSSSARPWTSASATSSPSTVQRPGQDALATHAQPIVVPGLCEGLAEDDEGGARVEPDCRRMRGGRAPIARPPPGGQVASRPSTICRARSGSPANLAYSASARPRRRMSSSRSDGVSRPASPASSLAASGAPRATARCAAPSRAAAVASSGPWAARARCRARSSGSATIEASRAWISRRRAVDVRERAATARSGWVKPIRPSVDRQDVGVERRLQRELHGAVDHLRQELDRRMGQGRRDGEGVLRRGRQAIQLVAEQQHQLFGQQQLHPGLQGWPARSRGRARARARRAGCRPRCHGFAAAWRGGARPPIAHGGAARARRGRGARRRIRSSRSPASGRSSPSGRPAGPSIRRARRTPIGSSPRRRSAKPRASADGESSHWTSSTATRTGPDRARPRSALRSATATVRGSGAGPSGSSRRSATRSARRWGAERDARASSSTPSKRSPIPA